MEMDDTCVVCAETLEWVAYGSCGHREVCSTCVARLRFICDDRRCCLCKSESNHIFVTKALGDYTRMINDFSVLPAEPTEGRAGSYWYHEDTQAYFNDLDHYKMIKAMCRLSCGVCDKMDEAGTDGPRRRGKFRSIEQLKGHLFHKHKLFMCSLCLEGRKVFICEQKLYTRPQLYQHINTGDSEVDGTESERGGFMGHPMCEFCRNSFYGDHELYSHMSTEHYTCHICQRQHPGQYEYYRNYDDLEMHFRQQHFLCEDESCLAKKFIVFTTEAEMKRHNAMEHGGNMSRSKRNAALQIPTSFHYQRRNEQGAHHGRGPSFHLESSDNQLSQAIQASLETAHIDSMRDNTASEVSNSRETIEIDSVVNPFQALAPADTEQSSRYRQAVSNNSRNASLQELSFPPLPVSASSSQQKSRSDSEGFGGSTMAARLRHKSNGTVKVLNSGQGWPAASRQQPSSSFSNPLRSRPTINSGPALSSTPASQALPAAAYGLMAASTSSSSQSSSGSNKVVHSASAPNLLDSSSSDFPLVSALQAKRSPTSNELLKVEDIQSANKSLVERMRAALDFDEDTYAAFKEISTEYRQGLIGTMEYLAYVHQFGLSHLVLDLAKLCPDPQKQKELVESYNAGLRSNGPNPSSSANAGGQAKGKRGSKKGKEKYEENGFSSSKDALADGIMNSVRQLQSNYKPSDKEVEVLSKDGYRLAKGQTKIVITDDRSELNTESHPHVEPSNQNDLQPTGDSSMKKTGTGGGGNKQKKKTSKFHRLRLGDDSSAATLNLDNPDPGPGPVAEQAEDLDAPSEGLSVHGVWRNGGGQRLVAMSQKNPKRC
ncbi:hypothetical protein RJ641_023784 [Dillenia turbinata]|uniref:RING-type E3 ubiquitin transferase n=1 Tax=Dillenia turbinata TaxID=194707 RepID=A0AAN8UH86_9MAGN